MKAKVYRENGYYFNSKTGEQFLWEKGAPATRRAIRHGEKKPSFGYKLRRFIRRLLCRAVRDCRRTAEKAAFFMDYTYRGETPPLSEKEMRRLHIHPDDRVIVLGAAKSACRAD